MKRILSLLVAVSLLAAFGAFLAAPSVRAQEEPPQPPPCPDGETCVVPEPCPAGPDCPDPIPCVVGEPCGANDADGDGWDDFTEQEFGSDPNDAASTPEHAYVPETCADAVDNDLDGATDGTDDGCNVDSDDDGVPDLSDNCAYDSNPGQEDADGDGAGDVCDFDADNDGWDDETERLFSSDPNDANSTPEHSQIKGSCADSVDNDADAMVDDADPGCAPDGDFDFVPDASDNCPTMYNPEQADADGDGSGDVCEDNDGDGFFDGDELALGSDPNNAASTPESAAYFETCSDAVDNDLDGAVDDQDEGCRVYLEAGESHGGDDDNPVAPVALPAGNSDTLDGEQSPLPAALPAAGVGGASQSDNASLLLIAALGVLAAAGAMTVGGLAARRAR